MKRPPSTQPLGVRHLVGTGILVAGVAGLAKLFIVLGHSEAARVSRSAQPSVPQARTDNARGHYGSQP